ncbi:protein kinase [Gemmatimonadota bacterium]
MASDHDVVERLNAALTDRYQIESEIGSGGMATVYLAQDLRHNRKVAVKVLKPELAAVVGTERFLAEIQTTANLSHPHILPLHDSGEADGFLFYVMPFVEGESLRNRLDRDGQLPVEEAVLIASHVADALESAHRNGVIHRDIKPGNILFQEGQAVVSDFGIALAVSAAGEGRLTETGLSLGTPYYMSPEQAAGDQTPTPASDVYSLGSVLYEMLTGEPPHTGASAQAILGKILLADVTRPTKLRRTIPGNVEGAVLKALERLPADRFESVAELSAALKDKAFRHGAEATVVAGPWKGLAFAFGVLAFLGIVGIMTGVLVVKPEPPPVLRQQIYSPGDGVDPSWSRWVALAPDGSSMVYRDTVGLESGHQLLVKERGSEEGRILSGTENARDVVYSPDGQHILYVIGTDLFRRPVHGAGRVRLLEGMAGSYVALSWLDDGTILAEQEPATLVRISEGGGAEPDTVFVFDPTRLVRARSLPGNRGALVITCEVSGCGTGSALGIVDLQADTAWTEMEDVLDAWYAPTGHVVWVRGDGGVFASPFDLSGLEISGTAVPLFDGVRTTNTSASMELGDDGTILFVQGGLVDVASGEVVWVDRVGRVEPVDEEWGNGDFGALALSPSGNRLAIQIADDGRSNIWVKELPAGPLTPVTTGEEFSLRPSWAPNEETIAYVVNQAGGYAIRSVPSDGSSAGVFEDVLDLEDIVPQAVFTPDGGGLLFRVGSSGGTADLGFMALETGEINDTLLATDFVELGMAPSPDGNWLAYVSDLSGSREVYVRRFPDMSGFRQVSRDGGTEPVWSGTAEELFFRGGDGWMIGARVSAGADFSVADRVRLFDAKPFRTASNARGYDYSPAEDRFIMVSEAGAATGGRDPQAPPVILIQNFFTELEGRLGGRD